MPRVTRSWFGHGVPVVPHARYPTRAPGARTGRGAVGGPLGAAGRARPLAGSLRSSALGRAQGGATGPFKR